jgi:hypothetical protein
MPRRGSRKIVATPTRVWPDDDDGLFAFWCGRECDPVMPRLGGVEG